MMGSYEVYLESTTHPTELSPLQIRRGYKGQLCGEAVPDGARMDDRVAFGRSLASVLSAEDELHTIEKRRIRD